MTGDIFSFYMFFFPKINILVLIVKSGTKNALLLLFYILT